MEKKSIQSHATIHHVRCRNERNRREQKYRLNFQVMGTAAILIDQFAGRRSQSQSMETFNPPKQKWVSFLCCLFYPNAHLCTPRPGSLLFYKVFSTLRGFSRIQNTQNRERKCGETLGNQDYLTFILLQIHARDSALSVSDLRSRRKSCLMPTRPLQYLQMRRSARDYFALMV